MKVVLLLLTLLSCSILCCQAQHHPQTDKEIAVKVDKLIRQMTLEEKVGMIHGNSLFTSAGVKRLGIPDFVMSDGPHGVRLEHGPNYVRPKDLKDAGTYLPTGVCLAATWNPALGYQFGAVLGSEASYRGKDVILGPGINIIRTALNGRNFEYQSEDPFLIAKMAVGYIKGVQDQGVSACVKHFMANNQELLRTSIDVQMSDRALNEIYLPGFKAAVTIGKVNTLMGSYNKFRGQWATQNDYLINQILKKDWGFKGIVISDWGAVHSTDQALWNGTDLEMGTDLGMRPRVDYGKFYMGDTVIHLVKAGKMPEYLINEKVRRILYVMFKTNMIDGHRKPGEYNTKSHQQTALKIAEEGIVLLKNQHQTLPLTAGTKSIAVIGYNATRPQALGGGSSQVKAFYEVTPLEGLKNVAGTNVQITYTQGYKIERGGVSDAKMIEEAVQAASKADVAIIVGGWTHGYNYAEWKDNAYDAEDTDKPDMLMPFGQDELIRAVVKANPKTVVVLLGGGPVDMTQWIDNTPAVIQAWYPGMEGGNALAKIIFGQVNPSGKLPMSFPKKLEDEPAHKLGEYPGNGVTVNYNDDIYVGYRFYDTFNVAPQFAFGHGLSYTTFKYGNLRISANSGKTVISFKIKNTGTIAGAETAQLYIKQEKLNLPRPEKELKGFAKLFLKAGEEKTATLTLDKDAFQYFNDLKGQWVSDAGFFDMIIGSSSKDIRLTGRVFHQ
ncbi:glycoside hydrolase family 3 C-terminal domain-containing protein [Mucilaginibacter sp. PPCGB 2223]|uniref:glycoside hydrolase family 3 C-terminal domain-containing protein n=1 Tax=Mucilaginibacter sp. PPCGB 2223 TaxID=1886027 RepID=UPI0009F45628|nr:glycoside hydrolase family 3 C-terminal domain-containing protein [Mucilaginibacter sp. PPCGB 2223]